MNHLTSFCLYTLYAEHTLFLSIMELYRLHLREEAGEDVLKSEAVLKSEKKNVLANVSAKYVTRLSHVRGFRLQSCFAQ